MLGQHRRGGGGLDQDRKAMGRERHNEKGAPYNRGGRASSECAGGEGGGRLLSWYRSRTASDPGAAGCAFVPPASVRPGRNHGGTVGGRLSGGRVGAPQWTRGTERGGDRHDVYVRTALGNVTPLAGKTVAGVLNASPVKATGKPGIDASAQPRWERHTASPRADSVPALFAVQGGRTRIIRHGATWSLHRTRN